MKKNILPFLTIVSLLAFSCENKKAETDTEANSKDSTSAETTTSEAAKDTTAYSFVVDTAQSNIQWVGKKVTDKHTGKIKIKSGNIETKGESIVDGSLIIDMNSISNEDVKDSKMNQKLIGHLRSDDFFSVEKHPTATFDITRVDAGEKEDDAIVTGNLTIKGKSSPISIPAHVEIDGSKIKASGKTTIDRTKWDIRYGSGKFFENLGDKAIYDEVELEFELEGNK